MSGSKNYGTFTQWNTMQQKEGALTLRDSEGMELENIMLSEISESVKEKYYMISPISGT